MASLKILKHKIKNIRSIQKITQSMKVVSAAKFFHIEHTLKSIKHFGIGTLNFYKCNFKEPQIPIASDICIVTTSDHGLCGSAHIRVCRLAIKKLEHKGKLRIICIGEKARSIFQFHYSKNIMLVISNICRAPQYLDASRIFNEVKKVKFFYGQIFYNEFKSRVSYTTNVLSAYDVAAIKWFANLNAFDDIEYEDVQSYVEFSTTSLLFYVLLENSCSELSSRMLAMDSASKNCSKMLNKLIITYNCVRQSQITQELVEIISGTFITGK